jgi:hypothetical protein
MWLFTTDGFYSIVTAGEFDEEVQVRARAGADLDRLRERWLPELGESVTIPHRDYPWRAFADRRSLADCLSRIALALDYDNFKDAVAEHQSHERAHVYRGVWSACHEIKDEPHAGARPRANGGDAIDYELADLVVPCSSTIEGGSSFGNQTITSTATSGRFRRVVPTRVKCLSRLHAGRSSRRPALSGRSSATFREFSRVESRDRRTTSTSCTCWTTRERTERRDVLTARRPRFAG